MRKVNPLLQHTAQRVTLLTPDFSLSLRFPDVSSVSDMAEPTAEATSASPDDTFGRPHAQQVSDSLQMWILIPGILALILAGVFIATFIAK